MADGSRSPLSPVCYVRGTRIRTDRGDAAIEDLVIGDLVVTLSGEKKPVKWLGHRFIDCSRHPDPQSSWPIRVSANAFAENVPSRDLWLSPGHGVWVDDVLITISEMQNGASVTQQERSSVEYWHVELNEHDVVFAENLAAETYGGWMRSFFANGGTVVEAHPDMSEEAAAKTYLPRVSGGPQVERVKTLLRDRVEAGLVNRNAANRLSA
jgi:hypothetical protein